MLGADVGECAYADSRLHRKLVIIGDGACGKTSLLSVFTLGYFPTVSPS
jgi:Rho family protein